MGNSSPAVTIATIYPCNPDGFFRSLICKVYLYLRKKTLMVYMKPSLQVQRLYNKVAQTLGSYSYVEEIIQIFVKRLIFILIVIELTLDHACTSRILPWTILVTIFGKDIDALEWVQHRAMKLVKSLSVLTYEDRLVSLQLYTFTLLLNRQR